MTWHEIKRRHPVGYTVLFTMGGLVLASVLTGAMTRPLGPDGLLSAVNTWGRAAFPLRNLGPVKLALEVMAHPNATAVDEPINFGLRTSVPLGGTAGNVQETLGGADVAGSTVTLNPPAAPAPSYGLSGRFAAPAAGDYALTVNVAAALATGADLAVRVSLRAYAI